MTKREMGPLFHKYVKLEAEIKRLKGERDKLNGKIKGVMLAEGIDVFTAGGCAAIVTHKSGAVRVDANALRRDLPEVAAKYSYQGAPTASLSVREIENKK